MIKHPELDKYRGLAVGWVDVEVPFHDIDAAHVVWHGHYLKYFELARCAALRMIDYDYPQMQASGYVWPVVDVRSRFIASLAYGAQLAIAAIIAEWEIRLLIKYLVIDKSSQRVVTRGQTTQAPVNIKTQALVFGCPDVLREKINAWQRGAATT